MGGLEWKAHCQCGHITYVVPDEYLALVMCYCTECQKASASIGAYSLFVPSESFQLTSGVLHSWERPSDLGTQNRAYFCPECSNRIYHQNPEEPDVIALKAVTLVNGGKLVPDAHVWTKSAPGWFQLPPDALAYETQPTLEDGLRAILVRRQGKR